MILTEEQASRFSCDTCSRHDIQMEYATDGRNPYCGEEFDVCTRRSDTCLYESWFHEHGLKTPYEIHDEQPKYRLYINDYGSWYGPEFVTENKSKGVEWNPNMEAVAYDTYSDSDACFYFYNIDDARKVQKQLAEWGHPATLFLEVK